MNCIKTIKRNPVPSDVFLKTTKLYYQMGKNEYYQDLLDSNYDYISKSTSDSDAYAFLRVFFPEFKITESRMRTLLLDSTVAKNNAEQLYKNLIFIFRHIRDKTLEPFALTVVEVNDLVKILFQSVGGLDKIQYRKFKTNTPTLISKESNSMREKMEELIREFVAVKREDNYEPLKLTCNIIVDKINNNITC